MDSKVPPATQVFIDLLSEMNPEFSGSKSTDFEVVSVTIELVARQGRHPLKVETNCVNARSLLDWLDGGSS